MNFLASIDYSVFPPINATLNGISTVLLIVGLILIKQGKREAHQKVMVSALVVSAIFLTCYLVYHYATPHTVFPEEYPVARMVYLAILVPHIILAVVNVPLILLLVIAAFRGNFAKHKKLARYAFPSWLYVSVTGVLIYFMVYVWFRPSSDHGEQRVSSTATHESIRAGGLVFHPATHTIDVDPGEDPIEVVFNVKNETADEIKITGLESGCACLSVSVDVNPIPAGESTAIIGLFDVRDLRGTSEKRITVETDRNVRPVFLTTQIAIDEIYSIEEDLTSWKLGEESETKTVKFRVLRDQPIRVLSAESNRTELSCEIEEIEDGRAYDLKLTPDSTDSTMLGIVRIETDCEIQSYARPLAYFVIQE
tara:strand:- start:2768 stop:3865 length:1098 start_codon:yes stop_codon:yes gene_type:complete